MDAGNLFYWVSVWGEKLYLYASVLQKYPRIDEFSGVENRSTEINSNGHSPISQLAPVYPGSHSQSQRLMPSLHVPWTHGLDAHSSMSAGREEGILENLELLYISSTLDPHTKMVIENRAAVYK